MPLDSSTLMTLLDRAAAAARLRQYRLQQRLSPPATPAELEALQESIPFALDTSFLDFFRIANGAEFTLFTPTVVGVECDDPIQIWSSQSVAEFYRTYLADDNTRPLLLSFGQREADYLALDPRQQVEGRIAVVFIEHDNPEAAYYDPPVAASFEEWLRRTLQNVSNGSFDYWSEPRFPVGSKKTHTSDETPDIDERRGS
jgi:hypothetical protein